MSFQMAGGPYLIAVTEAGLLIIHSSPITLSWAPRDVVNDVYNVGGTVTVGTFDSLDEAKQAARDQYPLTFEGWQANGNFTLRYECRNSNGDSHSSDRWSQGGASQGSLEIEGRRVHTRTKAADRVTRVPLKFQRPTPTAWSLFL